MTGAQIWYKNLGKYKYDVYFEFYRDCRGISFSKPNIILKSVSSGDTAKVTNYALVSITDITPTCANVSKYCYPANTTITTNKYAIEKHTYKATIDLTNWYNKGACQVLIGAGQCCRNSAITTGSTAEDFWVYSMVDLCKWAYNSSPILKTEPYPYITCNEPVYYNIGGRDTVDHDSLVFELADPMQNWSSKTTWGTGYSSQIPLNSYWPSGYNKSKGPDPYANPPIGYFLNSVTGETIFTPIGCTDVGPVATRVFEYHKDSSTGKYVLVGYVTRDYMNINRSNVYYSPNIKGPNIVYLADSTETSVYFSATNAVTTWRFGPSKDTVKIKMLLEPEQTKGTSFITLDPLQKNPVAKFTWKPMGVKKASPFFMVLEAKDNACEIYALSHKDVKLYVKKKSDLAWVEGKVFSDINNNCRKDTFEYNLSGNAISADGGKTAAFLADSSGYFGGWLPADSFNFRVMGEYTSSNCNKPLKVVAGKKYTLELGAISGVYISGVVFNDTNKNCKTDSTDLKLKGHMVYTVPGNFAATTDAKGFWQMRIPAANYQILYAAKHPYTIVKCPKKPYTVNFYSSNDIKNLDIAVLDTSNITDVSVALVTNNRHRRGYNSNANLVVKNNGNTNFLGGYVWVKFNKNIKYVSSSTYALKTDTTVKFSISALKPDEEIVFSVLLKADTVLKLNDTFTTRAWLDTMNLSKDFVKSNNYDRKTIKVVAAIDPNLKQEQNTAGFVWAGENKLRYFVQFQNTGTDTAVNITVVDTLHYALSWRTFSFNGASHASTYNLNGNILKVTFPNIYLVDTSKSKDRSIGYFDFSIELDPLYNKQFKFYNQAHIYFDFAKAVKTNKVYITNTSLVQAGPTDRVTYCGTDTISVNYSSKFKFNAGNQFKLYISDATGSFASGVKLLDSLKSTTSSGRMRFAIPSSFTAGDFYRIKITSTNPSGPVYDEALSNTFAIVKTIAKPSFGSTNKLHCTKDSVPININSTYNKFKLFSQSGLLKTTGSTNFKVKLPMGKNYLFVTAMVGSCSENSDTFKLNVDTLPITKLSTFSHSNLKVCGNDSVSLEIDGGFSSFLLLGNSLNFLDSVKSKKTKTVVPATNDQRTARVTSVLGCQNNSNTLVFTNIKKPTFTFTDSDADNEICPGDSVKFTVSGKGSIKFQLYKNDKPWLKTFKTSITSNDINNNDRIKVMGSDTLTGCADTSLPVTFGVSAFKVGLICDDSDLVICSNSLITLTMSGATTYKLYKNNKFWTAPSTNPITLFGINNNDEVYAEGTVKSCKNISNKLKFKVSTPSIGLKINSACIGDSLRLSFSGGVKYDLYKNSILYKTIKGQSFISKDFINNDQIFVDGTDSYGCSAYSTGLTITYKSLPSISITNPDKDNSTCFGENVTINFSGGNYYDLYKNNTLWKTNTGTTINFTDANDKDEIYAIGSNGSCSNASNKIKLTVLALPNIILTNSDTSNTICDGEVVTLNFTGGLKYDLYKNGILLQSNASSPYDAGNLKDKDSFHLIGAGANACKDTSQVVRIAVLSLPKVIITNVDKDNSHCNGDSVILLFSGAEKYDLYKNKIFWKLLTGNNIHFTGILDKDNIYAIGTDINGCRDTSQTIGFKVFSLPLKPVISKVGNSLSSNYSFGNQWYEGLNLINSATLQQFSPLATGNYLVIHTDQNGCKSPLSDPFSFVLSNVNVKIKGLKIYPNPANDFLIIETRESGHYLVSLVDMAGKLIKEESFNGNRFEWYLKPAKGMYHLKISNERGTTENVMVEFK